MADYSPPTEDLPIFDVNVFLTGDEPLTYNQAKKKFLKYPNAQGTENLQAINVAGIATFSNNVNFGSSTTPNLTPVITTNKSQFNIGNSGNGSVKVQCLMEVGGFGQLKMTSSQIVLGSGSFINQGATNTTANNMGLTNFQDITTFNGDVIQSNSESNNITQQTITTLNNKNTLRSTDFYGTLSIYNPTGQPGGDLRLWEVGGNGNSCQLYTGGSQLNIVNLTNNGYISFTNTNGSGVQSQSLRVNSDNMLIQTTNPPTQTAVQPVSSDSSNIIPTTAWVQGAISRLLTLNNTWTGTNSFNNTAVGSLTSNATQPASNDSSNKIPTTAWVQGAITAGAGGQDLTKNSLTISPNPSLSATTGIFNKYNVGAYYGQNWYGGGGRTIHFRMTNVPALVQTQVSPSVVYGNDYHSFTVEVSFFQSAQTSNYPNPTTLINKNSAVIQIFPTRLLGAGSYSPPVYGIARINNSIDGNTNYSMSNAYAPYGRPYWCSEFVYSTWNGTYSSSSTEVYIYWSASGSTVDFYVAANNYFTTTSYPTMTNASAKILGSLYNNITNPMQIQIV